LQNLQTKLYIGGELTDGLAGRTIDVINPADGTVLATVSEAGAEDIDRAVAAAGRAFPRWAATPTADRGRLLLRLGGTGSSGYGREMGFAAMAEYTTQKSVWINVDATLPDWYAP
jgi:acyl-CoA reductase-like NAD-dependent aldehyde dehydrogenase